MSHEYNNISKFQITFSLSLYYTGLLKQFLLVHKWLSKPMKFINMARIDVSWYKVLFNSILLLDHEEAYTRLIKLFLFIHNGSVNQ